MNSIRAQPISPHQCLGVCALMLAFWLIPTPAAFAGADATFAPAFTIATDYLEGTGGKIIAVMSLIGGLIGMLSGFRLGQVAGPVGVGIGAGVGVPIVTAAVGAVI